VSDVKGWIFDIKRFAVHDGPGVRSTVFFKGCPLRCWWCHNPEALSSGAQIAWLDSRCIGCGVCFQICPHQVHEMGADGRRLLHRERCEQCGGCVAECYCGALVIEGRQASVAQVMEVLLKDRDFYASSGGGVTLSGGEPLAQPAFALALLAACRAAGLHTALDTCGQAGWEVLESALPLVDLVLYDLKHMDSDRHLTYTGSGNERILENLRRLAERGVPLEVRMPIIPTLNDDDAAIDAAAEFLASLANVPRVRLLPYHRLADGKYQRLGLDNPMPQVAPPSDAALQRVAQRLAGRGVGHCELHGAWASKELGQGTRLASEPAT
jgi:pyruvate formate lyase activating enzyme